MAAWGRGRAGEGCWADRQMTGARSGAPGGGRWELVRCAEGRGPRAEAAKDAEGCAPGGSEFSGGEGSQ